MTEQTIAIYCFIDDFLIYVGRKDEEHSKLPDAELLTSAILVTRSFQGDLHSAYCYVRQQHGGADDKADDKQDLNTSSRYLVHHHAT